MKRVQCLLVCLLFLISAFSQARFRIEGKVDTKFNNDSVYLFTFTEDEAINKVDTAIVKNGSFSFTGEPDLHSLALISLGNYPEEVLSGQVALEEGTITVNLSSLSKVGGTPLNDLYQHYLDTITELKLRKQSWEKYEKSFIKDNINNPIGKTLFIEGGIHWLSGDFFDVYNVADSTWRKNKPIREAYLLSKKKDEEEARRTAINGKEYIDFTFKDIHGREKSIADYVGKAKILVFDVWASWCGPCRAEMPIWKKLYAEYADKGLLIVGISIDDNDIAWKNAIRSLQLPWEQLIVPKEMREQFEKAYAIGGIPHAICIGQDGKIAVSKLPAQLAKQIFSQILK